MDSDVYSGKKATNAQRSFLNFLTVVLTVKNKKFLEATQVENIKTFGFKVLVVISAFEHWS